MASDRVAPTVSVVMCTYNGAGFVVEQVESILAQTRPVDELVVSDDASADDTVALVEETVAAHGDGRPRLRLLRNAVALGVAANFASALSAATGEIIALSDQDDVWHRHRIERLLAAFERSPHAGLLQSDARLVAADGSDLGTTLFASLEITPAERAELRDGRAFDALLRRNLVTGATTMLRSGLRDRALPVPDGWIHDEWLAVIAAATTGTVMVDEALTDYRQHDENQIGVRKPRIGDRIGRLREPREQRNARLLVRAQSLATRLDGMSGVSERARELVHAKLAHERVRSALPARRLRRLGPVLREWRSGDYARFGRGAQDVLRDLVQPAR